MTERALIYLEETTDRKAFVEKIWGIFAEKFPPTSHQKVFIKPNVVSQEDYPTTTHPDTLETLLDLLGRSGYTQIEVGDAAAVDLPDPSQVIREHQLGRVCQQFGIPLRDLYQERFIQRESPRGYSLEMSALPLEADLIISLPVLKVHFICQLTGALKNQYGYLAKTERIRMHYDPNFPEEIKEAFQQMADQAGLKGSISRKDLDQGIAEVNVLARPHLFIVDAIETLVEANEQRHGGTKRFLGKMFAGTDPVALDCYGLSLLKEIEPKLADTSPQDIRYLQLAREYGLGSSDYQLIPI